MRFFLSIVTVVAVLNGCLNPNPLAGRNAMLVLLGVIAIACLDTARNSKSQ